MYCFVLIPTRTLANGQKIVETKRVERVKLLSDLVPRHNDINTLSTSNSSRCVINITYRLDKIK